jgi:uncharacterized protein
VAAQIRAGRLCRSRLVSGSQERDPKTEFGSRLVAHFTDVSLPAATSCYQRLVVSGKNTMLARFRAVLIMALVAISGPTYSASFDCRPFEHSKKCPEVAICSDANLSKLDDQLAASYQSLISKGPVRESERLKDEQRQWLKTRNECGCDIGCIESYYQQRMERLAELTAQPVGDRLAIGYDDEGKIDTSPQGCKAYVKETTEWDPVASEKASREVCAARKRHLEAYDQLQQSYQNLMIEMISDRRLNREEASTHLRTFIKSCIDHKYQLTTGGHNIQIDIIPNEIAAACLSLASKMLDYETSHLYHPW